MSTGEGKGVVNGDNSNQHAPCRMFTAPVGAHSGGSERHNNDHNRTDQQQRHVDASVSNAHNNSFDGEDLQRDAKGHADRNHHHHHRGNGNRNGQQHGIGDRGHSTSNTAQAEGMISDLEERYTKRRESCMVIVRARENAGRLRVEVLEMQERDEIYALSRTEKPRQRTATAAQQCSKACGSAGQEVHVDDVNVPVQERAVALCGDRMGRPRTPLQAGHLFLQSVVELLPTFSRAGTIWRRYAWRLLLCILALFCCRRLLLQ